MTRELLPPTDTQLHRKWNFALPSVVILFIIKQQLLSFDILLWSNTVILTNNVQTGLAYTVVVSVCTECMLIKKRAQLVII